MSFEDSVTYHVANLRAGNDESKAHQFIFDRYFDRLAMLTERRLGGAAGRAVSGEDVASIALAEFFRQVRKDGTFPSLHDRSQLWPLLATIAQRRAINLYSRERRQHLDGQLRGESVFGFSPEGEPFGLDQAIEGELSPESAEEILAECGDILHRLKRYDAQFNSRYFDVAIGLVARAFEVRDRGRPWAG